MQTTDDHTARPVAAPGLTSYRCKNPSGWTMIGAKDHDDAMSEARRSYDKSKREDLQVWNGAEYVPAHRPEVRIVQEGGTSDKTYCGLRKPDGSTIGGTRSALERYARAQGWRPVFVPAPKPFKVTHGL